MMKSDEPVYLYGARVRKKDATLFCLYFASSFEKC